MTQENLKLSFTMTPSTSSRMMTLCLDSPCEEVALPVTTHVCDITKSRSITFDDDNSRDSGFESHGSDNEVSPVSSPSNCLKTFADSSVVRRTLFFGKRSHAYEESPEKRLRNDDVTDIPDSSSSVMSLVMKSALDKMESEDNLIGDGSKSHTLPTIPGRHKDLKSISPQTLSQLLDGEYTDVISGYKIIDCRYPYEYEGGHIEGAINLHTEDLIADMMTSQQCDDVTWRNILIFHCEFSSERGPKLLRHMRNLDRKLNSDRYPFLFYPEVYLLDGGYKAFYEEYQCQCKPKSYRPMLHEDYASELRQFRSHSKSQKAGRPQRKISRRLQADASPLKCSLW